VKFVQGRQNGGPDGLSRRVQGTAQPEPEEEEDVEEIMETSLRGIRVERGPGRKRRERAYERFVGLSLAEEYSTVGEKPMNHRQRS